MQPPNQSSGGSRFDTGHVHLAFGRAHLASRRASGRGHVPSRAHLASRRASVIVGLLLLLVP